MNLFFDSLGCRISKNKNLKLKQILKKGNDLFEEELDILRILKSIRIINKEEESKFIIDLDEDCQTNSIITLHEKL